MPVLNHRVLDRFVNEVLRCVILLCMEALSVIWGPMPHEELIFFPEVVAEQPSRICDVESVILWLADRLVCQIEIVLDALFIPKVLEVIP